MDKLSVDALAIVAQVDKLSHAVNLAHDPRAVTRAKSRPNPAAYSPHPPAGCLAVIERGIAFQPRLEGIFPANQPGVTGVQIVFVHRPIRELGHLVGMGLERAPEVGEQSVLIVDRLGRWFVVGAGQEHGAAAEERLDVIGDLAEAFPDQWGDPGLAAEVREGCFLDSWPVSHKKTPSPPLPIVAGERGGLPELRW